MKLGYFGINMGPCAAPEAAMRVARAAEGAGFESVWTGEHIVLPDPQVPPSPAPPDTPMLDPAVALSFVAASTTTLKLGTGIIILPQRNPVELAKQLASLDVLSGGRLIFGIGAGYLKPEFDALGADFVTRGARTDEYIEAMRALWCQDRPEFKGRFVSFGGIQARPRPVQRCGPPVVVGGMSPAAFRRAARLGNGWYGFALDLDSTARCIAGVRAACGHEDRAPELGELEISVTPSIPLDADTVRRFEDLGVQRLVPMFLVRSAAELIARIESCAEQLIRGR